MPEISTEGRTHDQLHRDHKTEYNLIVDVDHDIKLIDDHEYSSKQEGYESVAALRERSLELRALLDAGRMDEFAEMLETLKLKVDRAPKLK